MGISKLSIQRAFADPRWRRWVFLKPPIIGPFDDLELVGEGSWGTGGII